MSTNVHTKGLSLNEMVNTALKKVNYPKKISKRITHQFLDKLVNEGYVINLSPDPREAAEQIREEQSSDKLLWLSEEHRHDSKTGNRVRKGFGKDYLHFDSAPVVRAAIRMSYLEQLERFDTSLIPRGGNVNRANHLSDWVMQVTALYPYYLIKSAFNVRTDDENPVSPIGFVYSPNGKADQKPRITTWMRLIKGHELYMMRGMDDFFIKMEDEVYARTVTFSAPSESDPNLVHLFTLDNLPIFYSDERAQYSHWLRMSVTDNSKDAIYNGRAHGGANAYWFTSNDIAAFYLVSEQINKKKRRNDGRTVQINPFPLPTKEMKAFVSDLRKRVFVTNVDRQFNETRNALNMTEMDRLIGADTLNRGYDANFYNWNVSDKK